MKRLLQRIGSIAAFFLLPAVGSAAVDQPVVVTVSVQSDEPIWVGQQVVVQVEVLGRDGWAQVRRTDDIEVPGALFFRAETQGARIEKKIGGTSYTGQRYELLVYPRREGVIEIPSVPLEVEIRQWGAAKEPQLENVTADGLRFRAEQPPGAEGLRDLVSAPRLEISQQWEPSGNEEPEVGGSFKRTIRMEANGILSAAFPPLSLSETDGVDIYPGQPAVENRISRGSLTGSRTESYTYIFKREGKAELPPVTVTWWDTNARELRQEVLPGRTVKVIAAPRLQAQPGAEGFLRRYMLPASAITLLLIMAVFLWSCRAPVVLRYKSWQAARQNSEQAAFKRMLKAARSNDPTASFNAAMQWLHRIQPDGEAPQLEAFMKQYGAAEDQEAVRQLLLAVSADRFCAWNGHAFRMAIKKVRAHRIKSARIQRKVDVILPELNPV